MKSQGVLEDCLQLLNDVSGCFTPRVLTALVHVSGVLTALILMDVLTITIFGYPKNQDTFARISGYCEQNDIHSPYVIVYESVLYSTWLPLPPDVNESTRKMFVEEEWSWLMGRSFSF